MALHHQYLQALPTAVQWLYQRRKSHHHNADIWDTKRNIKQICQNITAEAQRGDFNLTPRYFCKYNHTKIKYHQFDSQSALRIKALSEAIKPKVIKAVSSQCTHLVGNGGAYGAKKQLQAALKNYTFFYRSDIKSYYASMSHHTIMEQMHAILHDDFAQRAIYAFLKQSVTYGGNYWQNEKGIPLGSPLSPFIGAVYLKPLDDVMAQKDVFYVRFMDDWVILAKTRHKLKAAIRAQNQVLAALNLQLHPDKTQMGRIEKGFDFLGFTHHPGEIAPNQNTLNNHKTKVKQFAVSKQRRHHHLVKVERLKHQFNNLHININTSIKTKATAFKLLKSIQHSRSVIFAYKRCFEYIKYWGRWASCQMDVVN